MRKVDHTRICLMCGKEYQANNKSRKFCCRDCSTKYRTMNKQTISKVCKSCGIKFQVEFGSRNQKFCSRECVLASQRKNQWIDACAYCGRPVIVNWNNKTAKKRYCSSECYNKDRFARVETTCAGCGKVFEVYKSRVDYYNKLYCSKECYKQNGLIPTYGFKSNEKYELIRSRVCGTASYLRWKTSVLEKDGYKCSECSSTEELRVHHLLEMYLIIYKYNPELSLDKVEDIIKSSEFNDITNGITLCNSCHLKEHRVYSPLAE